MSKLGLNRAILIGIVDETPRLHGAGSAQARLKTRVLTVESYRDAAGAERERRAWHDVVVWGKRAEALAPWLARGKRVAVEGRIVNGRWEGADGRPRYRTEIHATEVVLLDDAGRGAGEGSSAPPALDAA